MKKIKAGHQPHPNTSQIEQALKADYKRSWIALEYKASEMTVLRIARRLGLVLPQYRNLKYKKAA